MAPGDSKSDGLSIAVDPLQSTVSARRWQRRDLLIVGAFFASCLAYTDRVNISVAAIAMQGQLGWSQTQKGFVLSSFFVGYMACLLLSGWLATRFGGRRVLGAAVIIWSLCTLLTPAAAMGSLAALIAVRVAMGVGESAVFPCGFELVGRWIPAQERTRAAALILSGIPVGQIAGLVLTGWILSHRTWPAAFYSFGVLGLLWALIWFRYLAFAPLPDPGSSARQPPAPSTDAAPADPPSPVAGRLSLRALWLRPPVIALLFGHFASNWTLYVLLAWLPSYFREVLHLSIVSAGLFAAGPWLTAFAVTNLAAPISDRLIAAGVSVTLTRKIMQCSGLVLSALFLLATRDVHSPGTALALLCAATGALGLTWCGYAPGLIDVAPRHSALLSGFTNTVATIPGIVGVSITGWLLDVTGTYSAAFILTAGVSFLSALVFGVFFQSRVLIR